MMGLGMHWGYCDARGPLLALRLPISEGVVTRHRQTTMSIAPSTEVHDA